MASYTLRFADQHNRVVTTRDCIARLIPAGTQVSIPKGTEVEITQALGGSYTVNVAGNLLRIEAVDADVLGKEVVAASEQAGGPPEVEKPIDEQVWDTLRTCYDPEIPVNIVELGLIYECRVSLLEDDTHSIFVKMTLTAPGCGMGPIIQAEVKSKLQALSSVSVVDVELTFDPPWDRDMLSEAAKLQLGMI